MTSTNIDTDAIIPKQFLKTIKRSGLGSALFYEWRFDLRTKKENPEFVLNTQPYRQSKIIVCTGANFGCGSSREHAPWALLDFGIKCVVASSFGDIFYNNMAKNGMLAAIVTDPKQLEAVAEEAKAGREIEVDLPAQVIRSVDGKELAKFEIDPFRKECLVNGWDDISLTLQLSDRISTFEGRRANAWPWLEGKAYLKRDRDGPVKIEAAPVPKTNRGEVINEPLEW